MALYDPNEFPVEAPARNDVADKLARSRELIERGWVQHLGCTDAEGHACATYWDAAVNFCSWGAIARVMGKEHLTGDPVWEALRRAVPGGGSAITWNDAPGRTQAEVVEMFRKAEAIARAAQ